MHPSGRGHSLITRAGGSAAHPPGERLELGEVGPAGCLHLSCTLQRAVPPCGGLRRRPFGVPEVCCPAWTWERKDQIKTLGNPPGFFFPSHVKSVREKRDRILSPYLRLMRSAARSRLRRRRPTLSCGLVPCRRSPSCFWSFPSRFGTLRTCG